MESPSLPQKGDVKAVLETGTPAQLVADMKGRDPGETVYCIGPDVIAVDKRKRPHNMCYYVQSWKIRDIKDPVEDSIVEFLGWGIQP